MSCVELKSGALWIHNRPAVLLCSSFFYFRIPREYWRARMRDLKKSGYNAIDVYFPWNYHEVEPGVWDFTGEKDVAAFLRLAREENLYVVARPGPYICSEWDGGGIPIWVHMQSDAVRQYDETYLAMFRQWMDRILPIIREHQLGHEGSIVLLQLENELDLFPCRHARRYMEAIRDMADAYGIEVPYVACVAGKGDVDAATGSVERINPAFNIYPPFSEPTVEEKMEIIQKEILMPRGLPLLATETEREHNFMRRELASGVRLISPYCQTATTNFDCRNGVSSWSSTPEKRIVYITNDYDMGSMLKSDGAITREFLEARLLANIIRTLGDKVAAGAPFALHDIQVQTGFRTNDEGVHAMALQGGGLMLCLPNLSREAGEAHVTWKGEQFSLTVEGDTTRLLLFGVNMGAWGYPSVTLQWSAADIAWIAGDEMVIYGEGDGVCLEVGGEKRVCVGGEAVTADGRTLHIRRVSREEAARAQSPWLPALDQPVLPPWQSREATVEASAPAEPMHAAREDDIQAMEKLGAYGGRGLYEFDVPPCQGLLVDNAADIATLKVDGRHVRTWVSDASMQRLPVTGGHAALQTEIWGHTCFDEAYNPLMYMSSLRGLEGAYAILEERAIHNNWRFAPDEGPFTGHVTPVWSALPCLTDFGALIPRSTTRSGMFRKEIRMPLAGDTRMLSLAGVSMTMAVYVNGHLVGEVDRTNPYVDLTAWTKPGRVEEIIVRVRADNCEAQPGALKLIGAEKIRRARIATQPVAAMTRKRPMEGGAVQLPLKLQGGEAIWLKVNIPPEENRELWLRPVGREVMVTVVNNGHVLGRLMPGSDVEALFRSGDSQRVWMPREWLRQDAEVCLLAEGLKDGAALEALSVDWR